MATKFNFTIGEEVYENCHAAEKRFINHFGRWYVHVSRIDKTLKCLLIFKQDHFDHEIVLDVTVHFTHKAADRSFSGKAIKLNKTNYQFVHASDDLNLFNAFKIDIEVDAGIISKLTRSDDEPALIKFNKKMFDERKAADITIKTADSKEIKASKFILSRSPVFDAMLNVHDTMEAQKGVIEIADIEHEVMVEVVRYMYTDEVPKIDEMTQDLLIAANKYDLPGLVAAAENSFMQKINVFNYRELLILADQMNLNILRDALDEFVFKNPEIFTMPEWYVLKDENLKLVADVLQNYVERLHRDAM